MDLPLCAEEEEEAAGAAEPCSAHRLAPASPAAALLPTKKERRKSKEAAERERRAAALAEAKAASALWQAAYPPPTPCPLADDGFALAFACPTQLDGSDCDPGALSFYARHGFVVFRAAICAQDAAVSRSEVWDCLEACYPGVSRADDASWAGLSSETYGLPPPPALFSQQLLRNRQAPPLVAAFAALLGCDCRAEAPARSRLLVSHDRFCFYRPTLGPAGREEWRTRQNLHLDLHPWSWGEADCESRRSVEALRFEQLRDFSKETNWVHAASGPHCQGVLSLADNAAADGGTLLVPGFAPRFERWLRALGPAERHSDAAACEARAAGDASRPWLIPRAQGGGSFKFAPADPLCALAVRVPLRCGDLLIWDQRCAHGAAGNASATPRYAQFVKAFPARGCGEGRLRARAAAVRRGCEAAGSLGEVSELGRRVFGFEWLE